MQPSAVHLTSCDPCRSLGPRTIPCPPASPHYLSGDQGQRLSRLRALRGGDTREPRDLPRENTRPASRVSLKAQKCSTAARRPVGLDLCPSPGQPAGTGFAPPQRGRGPPLRPTAPPASSSVVRRRGPRAVGGTERKLQFPEGLAPWPQRLLGEWVSF